MPELAPFDSLLESFIAERQVPGASLAVLRDGRVVLARGYGWADREQQIAVEPTSLFRIASISKPITAVAIFQLIDEGKLHLDDLVLDRLGHDAPLCLPEPADPRWRRITLRQLLQHTAGFDRDLSFDPMFQSVEIAKALSVPPPAEPKQIMQHMLGLPLDFDPGQRYAYSNFGYCLLGRIIEQVSGDSYEHFVRSQVLEPAGIAHMRIGKSLRRDRAEGEVTYYVANDEQGPSLFGDVGQPVSVPYGTWYHEALDAHGGWIGSALDLARFARAMDPNNVAAQVTNEALLAMRERPTGLAGAEADGAPKDAYYGCGWFARPVGSNGACNLWHTGSLPGTATLLVLRHDGLAWAVLFNTRSGPSGEHLGVAIDPLLHVAADAVESWPEHDLDPVPAE